MSYKQYRLIEKTAELTIEDLENKSGFFFRDKQEEDVRKLIDEQKKKRFSFRHPILGFLTRGKDERDAKKEIFRTLRKHYPWYSQEEELLAKKQELAAEKQRQIDKEKKDLELRELKINRGKNVADSIGKTILGVGNVAARAYTGAL